MLCGISSRFQLLSPSERQVAHALLTRSPLNSSSFGRSLIPKSSVRLACVRHAASVHPEPGSNSLKIIFKHPQVFKSFSELNRSVSFSLTFFSCYSQELLLYLKVLLKLIFKGFSSSRCLIFKVRCAAVFQSAPIYYQIISHLSTLFLNFFICSYQLFRVFRKVLLMLHKNC